MNNKRLELILLLENFFVFIVLYPLLVIPLSLLSDNVTVTVCKAFALILVMFAQNFIRKNVSNFFLFLLLHLCLIALCFLFGNGLFEKIGYALFGIITTIISYKIHFTSIQEPYQLSFLIAAEALFIISYIVAEHFSIVLIPNVLYAISILLIILFMFYYHGTNMALSLNNVANIKNQPIKQILSFNNKVIVMFLVFVLFLLLISPFMHISDFINLIGALLLGFIRFLFSLISSSPPLEQMPEQSETVPQDESIDYLLGQIKEPSIIVKIIEKIVMYAVSIAIIVGIVLLIGFTIYSFYKRFYSAGKKSEIDETKEFIGLVEIFGENPLTGILKKIIPNSFGSTNEQKIRRIFYIKVKKHIARGTKIEASETANEISKKIGSNENLPAFAHLYEKARYSNTPCTKEDINTANQILNGK